MGGKFLPTFRATLALGIASLVSVSAGQSFLIESFENQNDPAGWQEVSPAPQTLNAVNAASPSDYVTEHVADGALAGRFEFNWDLLGSQMATANPYYVAAGPLHYWSMRINIATPGALTNMTVPNESTVSADIYNNTPDTVQVAFMLHDGGGFERSPFKNLPPNASTTIRFDAATEPVTAFASGNGALDGPSSTLRGLIVYTETQPTQTPFSMDVDNVRFETQTDCCWDYDPPRLLVAEQGTAPGKLRIAWNAQPDTRLAGFNIYLGGDEDFGVPMPNAFEFPRPPVAMTGAEDRSVEIDVPTTGPIYVVIAARDAAPIPNELSGDMALGAFLRPDGAKPDDRVVLDLDRFEPLTFAYSTARYDRMIVYNAQALAAAGRYFESCRAEAVETDAVALTPNPEGVVVWSNGFDGDAASPIPQTITDGNIEKLRVFLAAGGKLMISGSAVGKGLATNGSAAAQSFFHDRLRAEYVSDDSSLQITGSGWPLDEVGTFNTGPEADTLAAWMTTDNEVYDSVECSNAVYSYAGGGKAVLAWGNQVVLFGFPFETVRDNAHPTFGGAAAMRASLLQSAFDYLLTPPNPLIRFFDAPHLVESFEDITDPASWLETAPSPQSSNSRNTTAPYAYRRDFATDGLQSGRFEFDWILPGTTASSNPYFPGGSAPTLFWSMRIHVGQPSGLVAPSIANATVLKADLYNNTSDTVQVAFYGMDGAGQLERSPFKPLPPHALTTLTFDRYGEPVTGFLTGNGALDGEELTFRGLFVYTEAAPVQSRFSVDVDNIRFDTLGCDCAYPAMPKIQWVGQGSAPGRLRVTWTPPSPSSVLYPDSLVYRVFLAGDAQLTNRIPERVEMPTDPVATVCPFAGQAEIDLPTTGSFYVRLDATEDDLAHRVLSFPSPILAASLRPDGLPPKDIIVIDQDRFFSYGESASVYGYTNLAVYPAQALATAGRYFESCMATAVAGGAVDLVLAKRGVVVWSNYRDGEVPPAQTISDANLEKLQTYLDEGGNLFLSGSGIGRGLGDRGSPPAQSFLREQLCVDSATVGVGNVEIAGGDEPFGDVGVFQTGPKPQAYAAGMTTENEAFQPTLDGVAALDYLLGGKAAVLSGNRTVLLGFPFETIRDSADPSFEAAAAARAVLLQSALDYLLAPTPLDELEGWVLR